MMMMMTMMMKMRPNLDSRHFTAYF